MATKPLKILVVDDDDDLRRTIALHLETAYTVFQAANGRQALDVITLERPHLMVLDMAMPGMDGLATLAAARKLHAGMTVIMLTGETDLDAARRALESGAVVYVTKPFDADFLRREIARLLEGAGPKGPEDPPWTVVQ